MAAARRAAGRAPERVILDSGAVIAWSRGDVRARAALTRALELDAEITVPVVVLAETLRGGPRDAPVHRVLKAVGVSPTEPSTGRVAGTLLGVTQGTNTVDALVAAEAVAAPGCTLVTGDGDDLGGLLVGQDVRIQLL